MLGAGLGTGSSVPDSGYEPSGIAVNNNLSGKAALIPYVLFIWRCHLMGRSATAGSRPCIMPAFNPH